MSEATSSSGNRTLKVKGRGHRRNDEDESEGRYDCRGGVFEAVQQQGAGPTKCKQLIKCFIMIINYYFIEYFMSL